MPEMTHMNTQMQQCIQNCEDCHRLCTQTASHCLEMGGKHAEANHIRLLLDCAEICHTSTDFMLRNSLFHAKTCAVCADVCERCAADCERIDANDQHMKACAEACRRCVDSCRRMATAMSA